MSLHEAATPARAGWGGSVPRALHRGTQSPSRSYRWQAFSGRWFRKAEDKSDESAGRVGDMTRETLRVTRRATEKSADGGREIHGKLPGGESDKT